MDANDIIENMKRFVSTSFSVEERGINAYLVHTGFFFPDGDELHIVLRLVDGRWILTDNGHTLMWLSYEDFNMTPARESLLRKAVESNFLTLDEDCISVDVDPSNGSAALRSMVQALLQIADLLYLDRQTVRSTFADDVKNLFVERFGDRCELDKKIGGEKGDSYVADVYVRGEVPLLVFSITSNERCLDVSYILLDLSRSDMKFTGLAIMDEKAEIGKKAEHRIINQADRLFVGISDMEAKLPRFLEKQGIPV